MKKIIFLICFVFLFFLTNFYFLKAEYDDDISYVDSANFLAGENIIVDNSKNTAGYRLDSNILRQEMAGIIAKTAGIPNKDICENIFTDVSDEKPNSWACLRIESLLDVGIIAKNTKYRPEDFVSKAEALGFILKSLYSYEYNKNYDANISWQQNAINFSKSKKILREEIGDYNQKAKRGFIFKIIYYALEDIANSAYHWEFCKNPKFDFWFESMENVSDKLQCLDLELPLDYSDPNSEKINISLTMELAKNPNSKNLLMVMGGPGQSGINFVNGFLPETKFSEKLLENFNIIGYSPRGVYPSSPQIDCGLNTQNLSFEEIMKNCLKNTGEKVLKNIGTKQAVEDLNQIRIALGDEKLSALSFSYGTKVLALYSEKYPNNLKSAVFDGLVDLKENMFEIYTGQEKGFQKAFENFVNYCLDYEGCYFDEESDYNLQFHKFLNFVEKNDFFDEYGNKIRVENIISIIQEKLIGGESHWMDIIDLLEDIGNKKTDVYNDLSGNLGKNQENSDEIKEDFSLEIINCVDSAPDFKNRDRLKYISEMKKIDNLSPYDNYKTKKDEDYLDLCFYLPFSGSDKFEIPNISKNLAQVLFVGQTFDPTTPYQNTLNMAKYFHNSPILTRNKNGHVISFSGESDCVDKFVLDYLMNPEKKLSSKTCD